MENLNLYILETCPYCIRVIKYLEENNIKVPIKNISEDINLKSELINIGGKGQVPALIIDSKVMYESNDIIEWFKRNHN